jgi:protocatechuate 3,4-dioxygenase beta subunit
MSNPTPFLAPSHRTRRQFLRDATLAAAGLAGASALGAFYRVPGLFAEELMLTPRVTEGPFYPDPLPLDRDNDLIIVGDSITPAVGEITHLSGKILTRAGEPIRNALVEIWQVDANGVYLHSGSVNGDARDANFQGYGRFETGSGGAYTFRTVKPVPYPGRTPHIHVAVTPPRRRERWTTQCCVKGHPMNADDGVLLGIRDERARQSLMIDFAPVEGSRIGELTARFDIVMGLTPEW